MHETEVLVALVEAASDLVGLKEDELGKGDIEAKKLAAKFLTAMWEKHMPETWEK